MKVEIVDMTPDHAAQLLKNNPQNRPIKAIHLANMARDMIAGKWQLNGDAIRLNGDGSLIDGQHRLSACVSAGVSFPTLLITGLSHDVRETIDGGAKRTFGDRLSMRGVHNANVVASSIKLIAGIAAGGEWRQVSLTSSEMDAILTRHPGIQESASKCHKVFPQTGTMMSAVHYIGCYLGREIEAELFRAVWKTGAPFYTNDAAHYARELFIKDASERNRLPLMTKQKIFVYSWLKFCAQSPMRSAKLPDVVTIPGWTLAALGI